MSPKSFEAECRVACSTNRVGRRKTFGPPRYRVERARQNRTSSCLPCVTELLLTSSLCGLGTHLTVISFVSVAKFGFRKTLIYLSSLSLSLSHPLSKSRVHTRPFCLCLPLRLAMGMSNPRGPRDLHSRRSGSRSWISVPRLKCAGERRNHGLGPLGPSAYKNALTGPRASTHSPTRSTTSASTTYPKP
jgi:hypothetical protein